jgi:hypothetical protein
VIEALAFLALPALACAALVVARGLRLPQARGAKIDVALRFGRWLIAALLAASGIWIAISPRADQPVLDALERAFPAIRSAYMDAKSLAIAAEPSAFAERNRDEAAKLQAREVRGRAREAKRVWIAGVFLLIAASLLISLPRARGAPRPRQEK